MPAKKASISINLLADASKAKAGFAEAEKAAGGLDQQFKAIGKTAVNAFATTQIINFGKGAVNAASDLAESANAVSVTFGDAADQILKLGENASKAVGLSATDFNGFAVQFAGFTRQLTTADKDIVDVTDELTVRIADFASVMNLDVPDAAQKFQSALAGSTEPMRAFGIDVSAAAVQTYALENGITNNAAAMTEAEKVQARYGLIMEQTAQMSGDFANTSDGLANSQRILAAEMENAKATVGEAMIPALQALMGVVKPVVEAFTALPEGMQQTIVLGAATAMGMKSLSTTLQGFGVKASTAAATAGALGVALTTVTIAMGEIAKRKAATENAEADMASALDETTKSFTEQTRAAIQNELITGDLGDAVQKLGLTYDDVIDAALGNADAIDRVNKATLAAIPIGADFGYYIRAHIGLLSDEEEAARLVKDTTRGYAEAIAQAARDQERLNAVTAKTYDEQLAAGEAVGANIVELNRLNTLLPQVTHETDKFVHTVAEGTVNMNGWSWSITQTDIEMQKLFGTLSDEQAVADFIAELTRATEALNNAKEGSAEAEQAYRDQMFAIQELIESHSELDSTFGKVLKVWVDQQDLKTTEEMLNNLIFLGGQLDIPQTVSDLVSMGFLTGGQALASSNISPTVRQDGLPTTAGTTVIIQNPYLSAEQYVDAIAQADRNGRPLVGTFPGNDTRR